MGTIEDKIKSLPSFGALKDDEIKKLGQNVRFLTLPKETRIFSALDKAEFVYVVFFGAIKLLKPTPDQRELVMAFLGKGDFCGAAVVQNDPPKYPVTAMTQEDSGLLQIPRRDFLENWKSHEFVSNVVQQNIFSRILEFQTDKSLAFAPVQAKVASFLIRTLDSQGEVFGNRIAIRLTRRDIADRVGTSIETVIRVLSDWTQKGWIVTTDQRIEILSKDKIKELVRD